MNQDIEAPAHAVMMETNRDFRLSSLNGYVVNFEANKPARVPPHCYVEAIRAGAIVSEDQTGAGPREQKEKVIPGADKAAELAEEAKQEYIKQGCLKLIALDDSTNFKADGYPKLNKLIAELPPECPRPTAGEVQAVFDELRDNLDLADTD